HWPRMTHDQLARVFPDGRTVHLPSNGGPLKGYELSPPHIERRGKGDDAAPVSKPSPCAPLVQGGQWEEPEQGTARTQGKREQSEKRVAAAAAPAKPADPVPTPRAKPQFAATLQLASADAQVVSAKSKSEPSKSESQPESNQVAQASADNAEPKPQTPADIIN